MKVALFAPLSVLLLLSLACQGGDGSPAPAPEPQQQPATSPPVFDASRAWSDLLAQVAIGPRPSGSAGNRELRDFLVEKLEAAGLSPIRETFIAKSTPVGDIPMENIYADFEGPLGADGQPAPMLTFGAHFDTKRLPFHFVGANDGASETAVLLELARVIAAGPPRPVTYRFLFLDGEEAVREYWIDPDNRYGSRHHVKLLTQKPGALRRVKAFILIDMVGDADLQLERDSYSNRKLLKLFTSTAEELNMPKLFARYATPIKDDHQSFIEFGIPSIDLIDLHYGPRNNEYWHTAEDTVEHCSQDSLDKVGRLLIAALPKLEKEFGK
jgi:glutaminyl-peptide cyclotransferase